MNETLPSFERIVAQAEALLNDLRLKRAMEKPHKWAKEKAAYASGKTIQFRWLSREWQDNTPDNPPCWDSWQGEYRIKPWSLQPPPFAEWHRQDWTEDMLPEGWRPLLKGEFIQQGDEFGFIPLYKSKAMNWQEPNDSVGKNSEYIEQAHVRTRRPLPDPEREAFTEWIESKFPGWSDGSLEYKTAWLAWQASASRS